MPDNLLNILSDSTNEIDNPKLMAYLKGQMSATEKHDFEEEMLRSDFMAEAMEGLGDFKNTGDVNGYAEQINRDLQKKLGKKKLRKDKRKLSQMPWLYFSIILILILAVISFIILRYHLL